MLILYRHFYELKQNKLHMCLIYQVLIEPFEPLEIFRRVDSSADFLPPGKYPLLPTFPSFWIVNFFSTVVIWNSMKRKIDSKKRQTYTSIGFSQAREWDRIQIYNPTLVYQALYILCVLVCARVLPSRTERKGVV